MGFGFVFSVVSSDDYCWAFRTFVFQTNDHYTDPLVSIIMGTIAVAHLREMDDPFQK